MSDNGAMRRMRRSLLATVVPAGLLFFVGGCMSHMPQTAAEFRTAVQGGAFLTRVTSFEANRPFAEVAGAFQTKAPQCLSVRVATESRTSTSYQYIVAAYKPTVVVGPTRAEVHVQEKHERGVMTVYQEPPDGHYYLVADATP